MNDLDELATLLEQNSYGVRLANETIQSRWLTAADAILSSDWLARVKAEAAAEALRDAVDEDGTTMPDVLGYRVAVVFVEELDDRADRIRSEAGIGGGGGHG